jgi:hypothetical protein
MHTNDFFRSDLYDLGREEDHMPRGIGPPPLAGCPKIDPFARVAERCSGLSAQVSQEGSNG